MSDDPLSDYLVECDEALASGRELPTPQVDAGPEAARRLECLRRLARLRPPRPQVIVEALPRVGRFELRRELGRGGFGTVYLAFDPKLNREVALKIPHPAALVAPDVRARFEQEAHAAAALDHPNIVPVYETDAVGPILFLVSAYCPGGSLADWLQRHREPVPFADAAGLVRTLAQAIAHAHERGVIHRDLKPANILIGPMGPMGPIGPIGPIGAPKITDFGLAKIVEAAGPATKTGAVVGTPQYMAPEQALGQPSRVGPAADIYALGAILYELLVGRPPFTGDVALDVLDQVRNAEPVPPRRLRPRIPRDLETICLKCLEKEPRHRYASAEALADDLQRFGDGRPVLARPVGPVGRAARWARRRPVIVGLSAVLALSVIVGVTAAVALWRQVGHEGEKRRLESEETGRQRLRADANFRRTRAVVERLTRLGQDLSDQPGIDKPRQALLEDALAVTQDVLAENAEDAELRREVARATISAGIIRHALGQESKANAAFEQAGAALDSLSDDTSARAERARCHVWAGRVRLENREYARAAAEFTAGVSLLQDLHERRPDLREFRVPLAEMLLERANAEQAVGRLPAAEQALNRAVALRGELPSSEVGGVADLRLQAREQELRMHLAIPQRRRADAERAGREALALRRRLVALEPKVARHRVDLARSLIHFHVFAKVNDRALAVESCREAVKLLEALVADYPGAPLYRERLADACGFLGNLLVHPATVDEAIRVHRQALEQTRLVKADFPERVSPRDLHQMHLSLARVLKQHGDIREAIENYREAAAAKPEGGVLSDLAWVLATADPPLRDPAEALRIADRAIQVDPKWPAAWRALGAARFRQGDLPGARDALEKGIGLQETAIPQDAFLLAMAFHKLGESEKSRDWLARGEALGRDSLQFNAEIRGLYAETKSVLKAPEK